MPWSGTGTYAPPVASFPEVNGTTIDAGRFNPTINDLATGITAALAKNGENVATANLPMGGFKHTGAGAGTASGEYLLYGQTAGALALGAAATPSHTFTGDLDTGMYSAGANTLNFATGGTLALSISSAQAVTFAGPLTGITNLTTTGNTILGNAQGDTLNVAAGAIAVGASGGVTIAAPASGAPLSISGADVTGDTLHLAGGLRLSGSNPQINCYGTSGDLELVTRDAALGVKLYRAASTLAYTITSAGAHTIATPSSGVGLTIAGGGLTVTGASILTGAVSGVTTLSMSGALSGATTGSFSGAVTASNLTSGTYTPILTATANVAAAVANVCQWLRVGSVVTVSGSCTIDPTTATTSTTLGIELPVASNFATQTQCAGTAGRTTAGSNLPGYIVANTGGDLAALTFFCDGDAANATWTFHFTYLIV